MKMRSQRGAARVSAVWLIVFLVLLIAALAFGYIAMDAQSQAQASVVDLQGRVDALQQEKETFFAQQRALSEVTGGYDTTSTGSVTDLEGAKANLQAAKTAAGVEGDPTISDYAAVWPLFVSQITTKDARIRTLESQVATLQAEVSAATTARNEMAATKDAEIASLRTQTNDLEQNARDAAAKLEADLARVRSEKAQKDTEFTQLKEQMQAALAQADLDEGKFVARIQKITSSMRLPREPLGKDGEILKVSKPLGLAYINKGSKDRVVRGMRFQILDGSPQSNAVKGEVEVTEVTGDHMAEVKILSQTDPYDHIVDGDEISNPLYDAEGNRNAVLAGRFSGTWNERELGLLMGEIGITVQPVLDGSTTFLIVGDALYTDPETGEALEEPMPVSDLAVYKEAEAMGAQIVHISEIRHFFRR